VSRIGAPVGQAGHTAMKSGGLCASFCMGFALMFLVSFVAWRIFYGLLGAVASV